MSDPDSLRTCTKGVLEDVGVDVRGDRSFLWLHVPEAVQPSLDLPAQACVTFDPDRVGEFDAELIAPGSFLLEKILDLGMRRGRWDIARCVLVSDDWVASALEGAPGLASGGPVEILDRGEEPLTLFTFRTTLTSDEKREAFHLVAVTRDGSDGWTVPWPIPEEGLTPVDLLGPVPDLHPAYVRATDVLCDQIAGELDAFRKASLAALEEEVRRIFRYFDGTIAEVLEAAPSGARDVVRAVEAERDRRLAEALERFEPHAAASLCSVRIIYVPNARVGCRTDHGDRVEILVDGLTKHTRILPGIPTEAGPAPPRGRPRSDTPPRRTRAGRDRARSPPESRAQSQSSASWHRGS